MSDKNSETIHREVRKRYARLAKEDGAPAQGISCCAADSQCCPPDTDQAVVFYDDQVIADLPNEVVGFSLGCGDPITLAELQPGQAVLDLGSGGGLDCFLAARKVAPDGHVIGVDMTPAMIDKAKENLMKQGLENVEFRLGEIEKLPVDDDSIDVVISNCVINLSPNKPQTFQEIFRVLKRGGKLAVSDTVASEPIAEAIKMDLQSWAACVAGSLTADEYEGMLKAAGFVNTTLDGAPQKGTMGVNTDVSGDNLKSNPDTDDLIHQVFNARITAYKP